MRGSTVAALLVAAASTQAPPVLAAEVVRVWMTTADGSQRLQEQAPLRFAPDAEPAGVTVTVDDETAYQTIDGFGASLTDSSAALLWKLPPARRTEILQRLFDPKKGIGLSFLRQPMGASDFSTIGNYSYDDMAAGERDPELRHFTIRHDLEYIVPELKQIKAINPKLRLMANPWSPPAWMKTSDSMIGGTLRGDARAAWADYFVRFVKAYEAQGLPIDFLSPQNEPLNLPADYPGMGLDAATEADLVAHHLGPALARAGIRARVLGWDHNWTNSYPYEVLKHEEAYPYLAGTAWHCYGGQVDSQGELARIFPRRDHWQTECSGFRGQSFAHDLRDDVSTIIGVTRNWGRSSVRWNLVLDENGGPRNGGCANCTPFVTVDSRTSAVRYEADYYAFGHASRFVAPGAVRIGSNTFDGGIETVAFANPDGSNALVTFNAGAAARTFRVFWRGRSFRYSLPAGAAATFRWAGCRPRTHAPTPAAAPSEAANLAALRPVTASSAERPETAASLAVDGISFTRWSSAFSDPQWIAVDLGESKAIGRVRLNWESAAGKEYQIQVSDDDADWTTIAEVTGGHGGIDEHRVAAHGRYVRVYGTARATPYGYSLWELEVYGASAPSAPEVFAAAELETK